MSVSTVKALADKLTIAEALRQASGLVPVSDSPRLDAELLLMAAGGFARTYLYTWPERELSSEVAKRYQHMLARRIKGEPVAHITGQREFWSLALQVNNTTLIPRPDTEVLVEVALTYLTQAALTQSTPSTHSTALTPAAAGAPKKPRLLDLGTGTGAVALALASELPTADIFAIDSSAEAVALAKLNAKACGLSLNVEQGSWYDAAWLNTVKQQPKFDCIVSNPPYIDETDIHLSQGDVVFEPLSALVAKNEGYADLFCIIDVAATLLAPGGALWLEHGYQQAPRVQAYLKAAGFTQVKSHNDYGGNPRVTGGILA